MQTTDQSPEERFVLNCVRVIQDEVSAVLGNVQRTRESNYTYGIGLLYRNTSEPPLTADGVLQQLSDVVAAHPEARIRSQVDASTIIVDVSVKAAEMAGKAVAARLTDSKSPFTLLEIEALSHLSAATAAKLRLDDADWDPPWAEVASAIGTQARAFAEMLSPTIAPGTPRGCWRALLDLISELGKKVT